MDTTEDQSRDLLSLVVPQHGALVASGGPFEPFGGDRFLQIGLRGLLDASSQVVAAVPSFFQGLQACGRPETTQWSYGLALLRWFRFLGAVEVAWDQATRVEARDFCR